VGLVHRSQRWLGGDDLTPALGHAPWSISRATSPPFLTHQVGDAYGGAGVCDEVHTPDQRVFVWHRDSLKALDKATDEELKIVSELIAAERRRRIRAN
jgi:hypothetical protein